MPAGGIHLCIAKEVANRLHINQTMNYLVGTVAPDSWRNSTSTKASSHFSSNDDSFDYDYEYFFRKYRDYIHNDFVLGYLVHLIVDKYWHSNNFITTIVRNDEYDELNKVCSNLIDRYNIPKLQLPSNLDSPIGELDLSGISVTVNYLNNVNYLSDINSVFNIDELLFRINETVAFVVNELLRLLERKQSAVLN